MKKIVPIIIVGIIVLSGLGAAAITRTEQTLIEKTETVIFSNPEITTKDGYAVVSIDNANAWLYTPNAPMLEKLDCKTVQEFVLLGDPSLKIGGYS